MPAAALPETGDTFETVAIDMENVTPGDHGLGKENHHDNKIQKLRLEWTGVSLVAHTQKGLFSKGGAAGAGGAGESKTILDQISGVANPGEVLAIMGPSGGGKTSLLNSLSRRQNITSGKILLNGKKLPS